VLLELRIGKGTVNFACDGTGDGLHEEGNGGVLDACIECQILRFVERLE
jgi:hypothetical protein